MKNKLYSILFLFIVTSLLVTACNLPERRAITTQPAVSTNTDILESTPTPVSLCNNQYFPNNSGDTWEYSGSNTAIGVYVRTDSITDSSGESFSVATTLANVPYSVTYSCSPDGLIANNPIQQYVGAILSSPDAPLQVELNSQSGISLPNKINPGDSWQQTAEWKASSSDFKLNGRFVFNYSAVGFEDITVPAGMYHALRVDTTIRIEVSGFRLLAGTYQTTSWLVAGIGLVKSEGTSHVPGVDFSDRMELTSFVATP